MGLEDLAFDEEGAIEPAREQSAGPHPRDILKREHDEMLKRGPMDARIKKRLLEIDEMITRDLDKK